jgi:hypothetical protein
VHNWSGSKITQSIEVSHKLKLKRLKKKKEKKTALRVPSGARSAFLWPLDNCKSDAYHSVVVLPSIGIDLPLRMHCSL